MRDSNSADYMKFSDCAEIHTPMFLDILYTPALGKGSPEMD